MMRLAFESDVQGPWVRSAGYTLVLSTPSPCTPKSALHSTKSLFAATSSATQASFFVPAWSVQRPTRSTYLPAETKGVAAALHMSAVELNQVSSAHAGTVPPVPKYTRPAGHLPA